MPRYAYPPYAGKLIILLGHGIPQRDWYLGEHAGALAALPGVLEYRANILSEQRSDCLTRDTNGDDPYGVQAVDEIKGTHWPSLRHLYDGVPVIGVYLCTEYMIRELHTNRPAGMKSPEKKKALRLI